MSTVEQCTIPARELGFSGPDAPINGLDAGRPARCGDWAPAESPGLADLGSFLLEECKTICGEILMKFNLVY